MVKLTDDRLTKQQKKEAFALYLHLINHFEVQHAPINKGEPMCKLCGRTAKAIVIDWDESMLKDYEPKKRWINFKDASFPNRKTKTFQIINRESKDMLGTITWSPHWRQYVFDDGTIALAEGCLYELFEKVKALREEREHSFKG